MKDIVLLGGNILNKGFSEIKQNLGVERVIVFDWSDNPSFKGDLFFQIDIKDSNAIINKLQEVKCEDLLFAYTSCDLGINSVCEIHKKYKLLAPQKSAVDLTLEKSLMTKVWYDKAILNRTSFKAIKLDTIFEKIKEIKTKEMIFKPDICSGSRGITVLKVDANETEIKQAFIRAQSASWDNKIVVEEFVNGVEYTVEMLGDNYGNVEVWAISKKYHTNYSKSNKIAVKLHYNANDVEKELCEAISKHAIKCYKSLGLTNSFGHLEVIVDENGTISPVEIGARSSGYIASHLVDYVNCKSYLKEYTKVIRGHEIGNGYTEKSTNSSMLFFYDMPEGKSVNDSKLTDFTAVGISSSLYDRSKIESGREYKIIDGDAERYGFEILKGEKNILTYNNINSAENKFLNKLYGR